MPHRYLPMTFPAQSANQCLRTAKHASVHAWDLKSRQRLGQLELLPMLTSDLVSVMVAGLNQMWLALAQVESWNEQREAGTWFGKY